MKLKHQMTKLIFSILFICILVSSTVTVNSYNETDEDNESNSTQSNTQSSEENNTENTTQNSTEQETKNTTQNTTKTNTNSNTDTKKTTQSAKSSNANLKSLGITPNDFKGFKPGTTSYNVTVPNNVEKVNVYATASDSKAKVTGTGNKELSVGENSVNVVVTAENGNEKTYTINITREEEQTVTETNNSAPNEATESDSSLSKLEVKGYKLNPEFAPNVYEYTLDINGDISDLEVIAEGKNDKVTIEVVGNTSLQDGENVITVLVYNEVTDENETYQIIVNKISADIEGVGNTLNEAVVKANKIRFILMVVVGCIIVTIIIFIIVYNYKRKKYEDEYDDDDYDEDDPDSFQKHIFQKANKEKFENSEKDKITKIANSIIDEDDEEYMNFKENEIKDDDIDEEEITQKSKRKGKHF